MKKLFGYQRDMVDRADKSCALFWDMGTGKTITSLEIYKKWKCKRLLIVCPLSMIDEWITEFKNQVGGTAGKLTNGDFDCNVINYEMLWRNVNLDWLDEECMIILDESHKIKNPLSKVGKFIKHLRCRTEYKMCLTGTPQSLGYIDLYNQLYFLGFMDMSFTAFKRRYCVYNLENFRGVRVQQLTGYKNISELERLYISKCNFLKLDRVYDEVIKYNYIDYSVPKLYNRVITDKVIYYDSDGNITHKKNDKHYRLLDNPGAFRFGLRSILDCKAKQSRLKELLDGYDGRVVIFYNFTHELNSLVSLVGNRPTSVYNGSGKELDAFKENANGVVLVNYRSGSTGVNDFVISNVFVAYSPCESYLDWVQSLKRIDRIGQEQTPIYYFFRGGIEKRIYKRLKEGKNYDDKLFIDESNCLNE